MRHKLYICIGGFIDFIQLYRVNPQCNDTRLKIIVNEVHYRTNNQFGEESGSFVCASNRRFI